MDAQAGRLIRRRGSCGGPGLTVEVVYEAGYITPEQARKGVGERDLPYDLEEACIATVMSWYSRRSMPPDVQSFWVEQIRVNFDTQRVATYAGAADPGPIPEVWLMAGGGPKVVKDVNKIQRRYQLNQLKIRQVKVGIFDDAPSWWPSAP